MRITTTIMLLTTTAVLACAQVASAATDEAWAKLFADAQKACHAETRLVGARTRGKPVDFEAFVLVAVDGRYPQIGRAHV